MLCAENANTAGHEVPKWVRRTGQTTFAFSYEICAFGKLIPESVFIRSSCTRKLLSDGQRGVIVWPSGFARSYHSPADQVCAYAFPQVVMTTASNVYVHPFVVMTNHHSFFCNVSTHSPK